MTKESKYSTFIACRYRKKKHGAVEKKRVLHQHSLKKKDIKKTPTVVNYRGV